MSIVLMQKIYHSPLVCSFRGNNWISVGSSSAFCRALAISEKKKCLSGEWVSLLKLFDVSLKARKNGTLIKILRDISRWETSSPDLCKIAATTIRVLVQMFTIGMTNSLRL